MEQLKEESTYSRTVAVKDDGRKIYFYDFANRLDGDSTINIAPASDFADTDNTRETEVGSNV